MLDVPRGNFITLTGALYVFFLGHLSQSLNVKLTATNPSPRSLASGSLEPGVFPTNGWHVWSQSIFPSFHVLLGIFSKIRSGKIIKGLCF
jgi:hypothetical protein